MPLILAERSERIMGCGIRVHRALGPGLLEKIYEAALCWELTNANLKDERQKSVAILYEAEPVGAHRLDRVVGGLVRGGPAPAFYGTATAQLFVMPPSRTSMAGQLATFT